MNTEQLIEFDRIKEKWGALALTDAAKERISGAGVFLEETALRKEQRDTTDSRELVEKLGAPPLQNVTELREIMGAAKRSECLTPYQLERVGSVLTVIERLHDYLKRGRQFGNPLAYYDENLDTLPELHDEILRTVRYDAVDDHASRLLSDLRSRIMELEESMKQKAEQVLRNNRECMADTFYTIRNGHVCVPVKKEYRYRVPGSLVDRSSTGSTCFVEPEGVAKLFEELQLRRIDEENEVYRILYTLTAMVADAAPSLEEDMRMIEKLDYIFSKGKLSIDLNCREPRINLERRIVLRNARHPLMDPAVAVPLNFELGTENTTATDETTSLYETEKSSAASDGKTKSGRGNVRGVIITGPNTGGKTVAIKTVMLTSYMAQCGLHVTCEEADVAMNSNYLCDIGDGQNISENLSTFSAHIKNVMEILGAVNRDSLVIMDELGSGTDPAEGMGIAVAILEELRASGANYLVTTHYPEIKEYAERTAGVLNARMTFDRETLQPTYRMVIGEAGESCAFYIAERLGMPKRMLRIAERAAYGQGSRRERGQKENEQTSGRPDGDGRLEQTNGRQDGQAGSGYAPGPDADRDEADDEGIGYRKTAAGRLVKAPKKHAAVAGARFSVGDSVMVYPDKKIGIVCEPEDEKGVLRVQIADRKIYVNHKRVKLHVKAEELYPADYDFSIVFDTAENRKKRHDMERKYTDEVIVRED